jgi:hypothetical protein
VSIASVEWGLRTCYGRIGEAPAQTEYCAEWADLVLGGADLRETTQHQTEDIYLSQCHCLVVPADLWSDYTRRQRWGLLMGVSMGREGDGGQRGCQIRVSGSRAHRESVVTHIRQTWPAYAAALAAQAAADMLDACRIPVQRDTLGRPRLSDAAQQALVAC